MSSLRVGVLTCNEGKKDTIPISCTAICAYKASCLFYTFKKKGCTTLTRPNFVAMTSHFGSIISYIISFQGLTCRYLSTHPPCFFAWLEVARMTPSEGIIINRSGSLKLGAAQFRYLASLFSTLQRTITCRDAGYSEPGNSWRCYVQFEQGSPLGDACCNYHH